jgi:outer membrane protein assembly factor BamB
MGSDQGTLHAIDTTTQTAKWTYPVPKTSGISLYYIQSTPTITDDGTVYFGCYDNYLYSLSADSGSLQWRFKTGNLVYASPMIDNNGYIYFGSHDKSFYCLSSSGTQIWKFSTTGRIYSTAAFSYSTAGLVYFVASSPDYQFYALYTATGTKKFTVTLGYDSQSMSSPTVDKSDTVYIGSNDGYLYRIYTDGTYKRLYKGSSYAIYGNPTLSKDRTTLFYGSYDKYIYAVTTGGSFKWKYQTKYYVQTSAVVDGDGLVIIGSISGDAYALHPDTGSVVWKFTNSLGLNSASIGADGTVYFSSYDYKLYAVGGGYSSCGSGEGLGPNFNSTTTSLDDACSACDAGTYSSDSYCVDCSEGYFQDAQGSSNCTACPAGKCFLTSLCLLAVYYCANSDVSNLSYAFFRMIHILTILLK